MKKLIIKDLDGLSSVYWKSSSVFLALGETRSGSQKHPEKRGSTLEGLMEVMT